jgi:hypothetical protein
MSALRRNGSIPTFGIVVPGSWPHDYFLLIRQSTKNRLDCSLHQAIVGLQPFSMQEGLFIFEQ